MTYNYFNPTDLAFGSRLTNAFKSLHHLADAASDNIKEVLENMAYFEQYNGRNYPIGRPNSPNAPCRTNEMFDLINDKGIYLNEISYIDNTLKVSIKAFDATTNRMTSATGTTTIREGYCYYRKSSSNRKYETEIIFSEEQNFGKGNLLFQYRIDKSGKINIVGEVKPINLIPNDLGGYNGLSLGDRLAGQDEEYTATDYECLCIIGRNKTLKVNKNDKHIVGSTESNGYISQQRGIRHAIVYVKPEDTISGLYAEIRRIDYK